MIRIALSGANGRMGMAIREAIALDQSFSLVAELTRDSGLTPLENNPEVLIDFTTPSATLEYLEACKKRDLPMVIGTTGFTSAEKDILIAASQRLPIVFSPNMSVGVNISLVVLDRITEILGKNTSVLLKETHHKHKKDKPSGTALQMATVINDRAGKTVIAPGDIESLRLEELIGVHSATFCLAGESLEVTHRASDRLIFANGALTAARWLIHQNPGLYDMKDVLGL